MAAEPTRKVRKMEGNHDDSTQKALEEIDSLQNQLEEVETKCSAEIMSVEQRYNKLRRPIQEKRTTLINSIPHFWLTCMMNHPDLSMLIYGTEEEDCLQHLNVIDICDFEDIVSGYCIKFYFNENPYFENPVLTKEFHFGSDNASSKSTEIIWKNGHKLGEPSDANRPAGVKRRLESMSKTFFSWFSDNVDPYTDDIAEDFKDDLWVNPLHYFLVADGQEEENNTMEEEGESESSDEGDSGNPETFDSSVNQTAELGS